MEATEADAHFARAVDKVPFLFRPCYFFKGTLVLVPWTALAKMADWQHVQTPIGKTSIATTLAIMSNKIGACK